MLNQVSAYFRFMDDIRIFCKDKYEARKILQILEFELRRCHLSVNSQKTKILTFPNKNDNSNSENLVTREAYDVTFDLELNKIIRLRNSSNYAHQNDAFHLCIKILKESLNEVDLNSSEDTSRKLNFALNTIAQLGKKSIHLYTEDSSFENALENAIKYLKDKPWITPQICKVLSLIPTNTLKKDFFKIIKEIVLDENYNIYSFQTYQLWLLLAKHKCDDEDLKKFAVAQIEKNDDTNKATIASKIIYICSVDLGYRRVILRKLGEEFTHGYFQDRIALISLRSFPTEIINLTNIHQNLSESHKFTYKYKDKDLVFVQGFDEDSESEDLFEQLYSI